MDKLFSQDRHLLQHPKPIVLAMLGIFILSAILIFAVLFYKTIPPENSPLLAVPTPIPQQYGVKTPSGIVQAPQVKFQQYIIPSNQPVIPTPVVSYLLKNVFSDQDVKSFAGKIGLEEYTTSGQQATVYNTTDKNKRGILTFDKNTGAFFYQSYGMWKPQGIISTKPLSNASVVLHQLGLDDTGIICTTTYRQKQFPTLTFVECHRDWNTLGEPLVNLGGVLNLSETQKIQQLKVGTPDPQGPLNTSIYNASDGMNGKARPNDFNSITIGFFPEGSVYSITSNLRWITNKTSIPSSDIISFQDALSQIKQNKATFSLTLPAGTGTIDFTKVYPNNVARGDIATVTDIALIYLEKPENTQQDSYIPFYLIRGTSQLTSGYTVKFVQVVPAQKSLLSQKNKRVVAGVQTSLLAGNPIQIGSFTPPPTQSPIPTPFTNPTTVPTTPIVSPIGSVPSQQPVSSPTPTPVTSVLPAQCTGSIPQGTDITLDIPGYGQMTIIATFESGYGVGNGNTVKHTIFFKNTTSSQIGMNNFKEAFFRSVQEQYLISLAKWLNSGYDTSKLKTIDDMYTLFNSINKPVSGTGEDCELIPGSAAPVTHRTACTRIDRGYTYNYSAAERIESDLATRGLQMIRDNKVNEIANKADLFPQEVLTDFSWVFFELPVASDQRTLCYISGISPVVFIYPLHPIAVTITTQIPVTYSDPPIQSYTWDITALPDGTIKIGENYTRKNIYYEYDGTRVIFSHPTSGFVIKTTELKTFITRDLKQRLGLNEQEATALFADSKNALVGRKNTPYLQLSMVSQEELSSQLPLKILPQPDHLYRMHLIIKPLNEFISGSSPAVPSITRDGFTVVEIGARVDQ